MLLLYPEIKCCAMKELKRGFRGERILVIPNSVKQEIEKHPLSSLLYITDIGYYPHAKYHYIIRHEPINQYVFIYCINGSGWFSVGGGEMVNVTKNQYFVLPANIAHSYGSDADSPWTIYWIHFRGKLAPQYASGLAVPTEIKTNIYSRISGRIDLFEEMFHTLEQGYNMENILYACSVFYHFLGTLRYLKQYRNAVKNESGEDEEDIVAAAIHFMKENIEARLSLAELSKRVGYSPSYFSMVFTKRVGYSPTTYFNMLKVQKACQLIDFTDMKINQICPKVGIDDCYYFSRLFTKVMGFSPREYKKRTKG